jgi:multiple sugar transport system permease protein
MNIPTDQFVGLKYILRALKDVNVWQGIWVALKFWFVGNLLVQITALMLAAIFTYLRIRGAHFFKSSFYLPSLVSTSVVATIFSLFIGYPDGTINQLLLKLGIIVKPQLFVYMKVVIFSLIVFLGWWMGFGGTTIIANAGMTSISPDLYEAAKIDGANFFQVFTKITIPLIWPVLTYMWLTGLIWGLQVFDIPFMITKSTAGGPDNIARTIVMYIYRHGLEVGNMGYAAGINIVFFLTIVILSFLMLFIMRKQGEQSKLAK